MAVGAYALTSLANVKAYLGIATGTTTWDTLLEALIDRVSDRIERVAGRQFVARDYVEYQTGSDQLALRVDQYPIIKVYRVTISETDGIRVTYSGSAGYATVAVQGSVLYLFEDGAATNSFDLTNASYDTLTELVAAIDAEASFACTLSHDNGAADSADLLIQPGIYIKSGDYYDFPIAEEGLDDYAFNPSEGILYRHAGWPRSWQTIRVAYNAGYATTPGDLEAICIELVAYGFRLRDQNTALQSESLGDYSYTLASTLANQAATEAGIRERLGPWLELR